MAVAVEALFQQFDNTGRPLSGGRVYTYAAGTTNPLASYTDQGGSVPNTNPVILDSAGRANIWLTANVAYKLILTDALGAIIRTVDNYYAGASPEQLSIAGIVPATGGNYTGAVGFNGGVIFGGTPAQDLATLDSLNIAGAQVRNLWINPDLSILQRGLNTYTDGSYSFDRVVTLTQTAGALISQLSQPTDGIPFAGRWTQSNATAQRIGFSQPVEARNCLMLRGKQAVFALKVRCSAAVTVRAAIVAWTGSQDFPTADIINSWTSTNYTAGNFFIANTTTLAVNGVAVQANTWTDLVVSSVSAGGVSVPSTLQNLVLVVWTDSTLAQAATLDASLLRCAQGTEAPNLQPLDAQQELARCQRYYAKMDGNAQAVAAVGTGLYYNTTQASIWVNWPVPTRVIPTIGFANAGTWTGLTAGGVLNLGPASAGTGTQYGGELLFNSAATGTSGAAVLCRIGTVGNFLSATAEL